MERRNSVDPAALAAKLRFKLDQAQAREPVCRETVDAGSGEAVADSEDDTALNEKQPEPVRRTLADRAERLQTRLGLSHVNRWVLAGVAIAVAAAGLFITVMSWPKAEPAATAPAAPVETAAPQPETIVVSVAGAVKDPGIVELEEGARVADAIEAAGGLADGADTGFLNLARVVADGDLVAVTEAAAAPGAESDAAAGDTGGGGAGNPVNVNVADAAALDSLKGIGPVLAERIVAYREEHGSFQSVDELAEVSGIGPALLEQIREQVTL